MPRDNIFANHFDHNMLIRNFVNARLELFNISTKFAIIYPEKMPVITYSQFINYG